MQEILLKETIIWFKNIFIYIACLVYLFSLGPVYLVSLDPVRNHFVYIFYSIDFLCILWNALMIGNAFFEMHLL